MLPPRANSADRAGSGPDTPLLPDDGRGRDRQQRTGREQYVHHQVAGRTSAILNSLNRSLACSRHRAEIVSRAGRSGQRRWRPAAPPAAVCWSLTTMPSQRDLMRRFLTRRRLCRPDRQRRQGRAAPGAAAAAGRHHSGCHDAGYGRLDRAVLLKADAWCATFPSSC